MIASLERMRWAALMAGYVTGSYREKQRQEGMRKLTRWRFVDTWAYKEHSWVLIAAGSAPIRD